jgi:hypothetical protein
VEAVTPKPTCVLCGNALAATLEPSTVKPGEYVCRHTDSCRARRGDEFGPDEQKPHLIRATWNRRLLGVVWIYAFADHSYGIDIGRASKPPLITIGWTGWRPTFVRLRRWTRSR